MGCGFLFCMAARMCHVSGMSLSEPKRILFLQSDSVFERFGGIEHYLDDLITLAGEVYGFENLRTLIPRRREQLSDLERPYRPEFVRFSKSPLLQKLQNRFSPAYYRRARKLLEEFRPNLIFNTHVSLGPMAHALARATKIPTLTCVYGIDCWGGLWRQDEWALRRASRIVSISHWTQKVLVDRGYDPARFRIIHPRIGTQYETVQAKSDRAEGPLVMLSVSRLDASEQYKGQDHVLQAMAKLRARSPELDLRYIIHGEGDDRPRLENLARSLGLEDRVQFPGFVQDRSELHAVYRSADVFVMPSRFGHWDGRWRGEGFGIVYAEAAAFGVPSVAYNCGGVTDIVRDGETGRLVEPDNLEALASALEDLARNREQLQRMGNRAREDVLKRFTRPAIATELESALEGFGSPLAAVPEGAAR